MNVQEWETTYKPVVNKFDENASWQDDTGNGIMFETYGVELDYVRNQDSQHIWTYIDGDDNYWIVAGYKLVNRIGYFVTEIGWDSQDIVIKVD